MRALQAASFYPAAGKAHVAAPPIFLTTLAPSEFFTLKLRPPALAAFYLTFRGPMYDHRIGLTPEDALPARRVEAKVKWFNASKGFGFCLLYTSPSPRDRQKSRM